jgi:hypothetical protein
MHLEACLCHLEAAPNVRKGQTKLLTRLTQCGLWRAHSWSVGIPCSVMGALDLAQILLTPAHWNEQPPQQLLATSVQTELWPLFFKRVRCTAKASAQE